MDEHSIIEAQDSPDEKGRKSAADFRAMLDQYTNEIEKVTESEKQKKEMRLSKIDRIIKDAQEIGQILDGDLSNISNISSITSRTSKLDTMESKEMSSLRN